MEEHKNIITLCALSILITDYLHDLLQRREWRKRIKKGDGYAVTLRNLHKIAETYSDATFQHTHSSIPLNEYGDLADEIEKEMIPYLEIPSDLGKATFISGVIGAYSLTMASNIKKSYQPLISAAYRAVNLAKPSKTLLNNIAVFTEGFQENS